MKESIYYIFQTENSIKRFFAFFAWLLITVFSINITGMLSPVATLGNVTPLFYILVLLSFVITFIPLGYSTLCIKNMLRSGINTELPFFNIKKIYIEGIRTITFFILAFAIPFAILYILGFINNFVINHNFIPISFLICVFSFLLLFIVLFLIPAIFALYADKNDILAFIKVPAAIKIINNNLKFYFRNFLIIYLLLLIFYLFRLFLLYFLMPFGIFGLIIYSILLSFCITILVILLLQLCAKSINTVI